MSLIIDFLILYSLILIHELGHFVAAKIRNHPAKVFPTWYGLATKIGFKRIQLKEWYFFSLAGLIFSLPYTIGAFFLFPNLWNSAWFWFLMWGLVAILDLFQIVVFFIENKQNPKFTHVTDKTVIVFGLEVKENA